MPYRRSKRKLTDYEPKRRNPITLGDDSNIDKNLKVIKVDSKNSILELSENELKVRGTIDASAITVDGASVQTGTDAGATELNELSDVTYSSGDLTITSLDKIISGSLEFDSSGNITLDAAGGAIVVHSADIKIPAEKKLYLDGNALSPETYIVEHSADLVRIVVGGDTMVQLSEKGTDGNEVSFGESCVGFTQLEPTYSSSVTTVDFRHSNKQFVTFGSGNITTLDMYFPSMSGNFTILIKQDGTGSRTITNYRVRDSAGNLASGDNEAKFAGGSNPTLTTDANHVDIISFYWDADNEIAYGVASLDFQD